MDNRFKQVYIDETDRVILININRKYEEGMSQSEILEAVCCCWVVGERREGADYVLATYQGIVKGVFLIDNWLFKKIENNRERWAFEGEVAPASITNKYIDGSISHYIKRGSQNPIFYINCPH